MLHSIAFLGDLKEYLMVTCSREDVCEQCSEGWDQNKRALLPQESRRTVCSQLCMGVAGDPACVWATSAGACRPSQNTSGLTERDSLYLGGDTRAPPLPLSPFPYLVWSEYPSGSSSPSGHQPDVPLGQETDVLGDELVRKREAVGRTGALKDRRLCCLAHPG